MSYQTAYTTHFHSLDNTLWDIEIHIDGHTGQPLEIKLEGDEPCVIEWQETGKTDVVQSSACTLRVSNESDRQMAALMRLTDQAGAFAYVFRNRSLYWCGYLDDALYEEPYSFRSGYVTELTFSDFGILNRIPFALTGKQSVEAIVRDCLASALPTGSHFSLLTSLLDPKTHQPITLDMLYINADRFASDGDSWGTMTTKREVLEEILRPLGLRVMQKNGQIFIYDIEWLRDHDGYQRAVAWKGTDAVLKGGESYGRFEVGFETDTVETIAEDGLDYDSDLWSGQTRYLARSYSSYTGRLGHIGFLIETRTSFPGANTHIAGGHKYFRTRPIMSDSRDIGWAGRIVCRKAVYFTEQNGILESGPTTRSYLVYQGIKHIIATVGDVMWFEPYYLPLAPDRDQYQLRVNLDMLLSFRENPFDRPSQEWIDIQPFRIIENKWQHFRIYIPVKLEVLADDDTVLCHYENADYDTIEVPSLPMTVDIVNPFGIGSGRWANGPAEHGNMYLSYYPSDGGTKIIEKGWVTNRIASNTQKPINETLYGVRQDGEYVSLPPVAGRLRLTVGDGIFTDGPYSNIFIANLKDFEENFTWWAFRNAKITVVKANLKDDSIDNDTVYHRAKPRPLSSILSETLEAGCWRDGIAPSARGMLFRSDGTVWEKLEKDGRQRSLQLLRRESLIDQTLYPQPVLSGTAELDARFGARRDSGTPGVFLVTALRQDLHEDLERVTMARIANAGGFVYDFAWSDPLCAEDPEPYAFAWSGPVCAKQPSYGFAWSDPVCAKQYTYKLQWEDMDD